MQQYIPLKPIPIRDRASIAFIEKGRIDVEDGAFVVFDKAGVTQIPVGGLAALMLEPGTRITHAAIKLASQVGCLTVWVGEGGVRLYAAGQPGGASAAKLLYQAKVALDDTARLAVVREMYARRFGEPAPERRSIDQLRGMEGARVRALYQQLAADAGIAWNGRRYDAANWRAADLPNQAVSAATAALYGLAEAAILAAGYAPAIGFLHRGRALSFVYDIADLYKFETVVPAAFATAARIATGEINERPERAVRLACRDAFRRTRLLDRIIPDIHSVLAAGGIDPPEEAPEGVEPVLPQEEASGDAGHRV